MPNAQPTRARGSNQGSHGPGPFLLLRAEGAAFRLLPSPTARRENRNWLLVTLAFKAPFASHGATVGGRFGSGDLQL